VREAQSFASALWIKVIIGFGLALLVAETLPRTVGSGATPPVRTLVLTAALVTVFTTAALYLGIRHNLGLGARVAVYAVSYNALIVAVKFGLAPYGLYEVNQRVDLTQLFPVSDPFGALWTASLVFALYLGGYYLVYRLVRARIQGLAADDERHPRRAVLALIGGAYALAGAGIVLLVVFGLGRVGGEYVDFALSSSVSILIAVALAGAGSLAALAFKDARDQAEIVGDAALLVSFFWLGLAFLALYHVLWVVYILVLTAVWPLKVVVPK
jgi:hypothetical protein